MFSLYLDYAASAPMQPQVWDAMVPYYREHYGNPSSLHAYGRSAQSAVRGARDDLARILGCKSGEIVFTSGGTESDNLALFGVAGSAPKDKRHIIATAIEHHAVLNTCRQLQNMGFEITLLPVNEYGRVSASDVASSIREDTLLISVMHGNNETGTLQPIEEIGRLARERGILMHTDAIQTFGKIPLDFAALPVDLLSASAHKLGGPKGTGLLVVSDRLSLTPMLFGGEQERRKRAGTENVAGIAGFAKAAELAAAHLQAAKEHEEQLRSVMAGEFHKELGSAGFTINGHPEPSGRLPHILNVSFPGIQTETMLMNLDLEGIAASGGSACSSGSLEASHVLKAMNLPEDRTSSAVRFSFGPELDIEAVAAAARKTATIVRRIRI